MVSQRNADLGAGKAVLGVTKRDQKMLCSCTPVKKQRGEKKHIRKHKNSLKWCEELEDANNLLQPLAASSGIWVTSTLGHRRAREG